MKIQYYEGKNNHQWYWRMLADNGKIIADGSEGYDSKGNVNRAIEHFISLFIDPPAVEERPTD